MRFPFIFIFASALFYAVIFGVIDELFKINLGIFFLSPVLGVQTYAKYGAARKYGIFVILSSLICLLMPDIIKACIKIGTKISVNYSRGQINWAWDITDFISFLPYLFSSLILGFLFSQGFLLKKLFN